MWGFLLLFLCLRFYVLFVYLRKKCCYMRKFLDLKKIISWVEVIENLDDREYI